MAYGMEASKYEEDIWCPVAAGGMAGLLAKPAGGVRRARKWRKARQVATQRCRTATRISRLARLSPGQLRFLLLLETKDLNHYKIY
jgi:hypothetical protein